MTNVAHAFEHFVRAVETSGLTVSEDSAAGSRLARVGHDGAELRLDWDEQDEFLSLQLSHGPESQQAGWLELYAAECRGGELQKSTDPSMSFESSVEYGLELMCPSA